MMPVNLDPRVQSAESAEARGQASSGEGGGGFVDLLAALQTEAMLEELPEELAQSAPLDAGLDEALPEDVARLAPELLLDRTAAEDAERVTDLARELAPEAERFAREVVDEAGRLAQRDVEASAETGDRIPEAIAADVRPTLAADPALVGNAPATTANASAAREVDLQSAAREPVELARSLAEVAGSERAAVPTERPVQAQSADPAFDRALASESAERSAASDAGRDNGAGDPRAGNPFNEQAQAPPPLAATDTAVRIEMPALPSAPLAGALNGAGIAPSSTLSPTLLDATAPAQPVDAVPRQIEWLTSQGGGSARIRLDPPNLGELEITVSVRGQVVEVSIRADEPAAQAAVLATRDQLADSLGQRDLRMDRFDVGGQQADGGAREQGTQAGRDEADRDARNARDLAAGVPLRRPGALPDATPVSAGRGLDLRA